jgi:exodeoxyribonuclease VII small subunit
MSKPFEFEPALRELEEITQWFESSEVDLDRGLDKFERGMELAGQLKAHLAGVENRVEKIKARFAAGTGTEHGSSPHEDSADEQPPLSDDSAARDQTGLFSA